MRCGKLPGNYKEAAITVACTMETCRCSTPGTNSPRVERTTPPLTDSTHHSYLTTPLYTARAWRREHVANGRLHGRLVKPHLTTVRGQRQMRPVLVRSMRPTSPRSGQGDSLNAGAVTLVLRGTAPKDEYEHCHSLGVVVGRPWMADPGSESRPVGCMAYTSRSPWCSGGGHEKSPRVVGGGEVTVQCSTTTPPNRKVCGSVSSTHLQV